MCSDELLNFQQSRLLSRIFVCPLCLFFTGEHHQLIYLQAWLRDCVETMCCHFPTSPPSGL